MRQHILRLLMGQAFIDAMPGYSLDFSLALQELGPQGAMTIANGRRPNESYVFAEILPPLNRDSYQVDSGSMLVRATMAGLVAIDGPLPPTGQIEISKFAAEVAKIGAKSMFNEKAQRELQAFLRQRFVEAGGRFNDLQAMIDTVTNLLNMAVIQPMIDTEEYLRGQALVLGAINWTFNGQTLTVDYGIPAENKLPTRAGNDRYGGTSSKFWDDILDLQMALKWDVDRYLIHSRTLDKIVRNPANMVQLQSDERLARGRRRVRLAKYRNDTNATLESDSRFTVTLETHDSEAEVYDLQNPGRTIKRPFMSLGKIVAVGIGGNTNDVIGTGSQSEPLPETALGYTHLGPTVEGGGRGGRYARAYIPEAHPERFIVEGVANVLPCITEPEKIAVATTEMA